MTSRLRGSLLANLLWLPAFAVGALQMARIDAGPLTKWGADFFAPIALYASFRTGGTVARWFMKTPPSPLASAVIVLAGCFAWELCQLFDLDGTLLAITSGSFDPIDLAAYVAGTGMAFGIESTVRRTKITPGSEPVHH